MLNEGVLFCALAFLGQPDSRSNSTTTYAASATFDESARIILRNPTRIGRGKQRCVSLSYPYLYSLDQTGCLYVFELNSSPPFWRNLFAGQKPSLEDERLFAKLESIDPLDSVQLRKLLTEEFNSRPEMDQFENAREVSAVETGCDGNVMVRDGETLFLTKAGRLAVYSLDDPRVPRLLGLFGEAGPSVGLTLILHRHILFVLGDGTIATFDVTDPSTPKQLGICPTRPGRLVSACVASANLYAACMAPGGFAESGILVLDVSDARIPKEVGFVPAAGAAHHLFPWGKSELVVCYGCRGAKDEDVFRQVLIPGVDSGGGGRQCDGISIYSIKTKAVPALLATVRSFGVASAVKIANDKEEFLILDGAVVTIRDNRIQPVTCLHTVNTTSIVRTPLFECYTGSVDGNRAALVGDDNNIAVFKMTDKKRE